ncbi:MAG: hypothetical protein HQK50_18710 [Oligoflexia bacterium]|nr:hypothetical protein [Oligoflexia bacterium]MBF0367613.1 hypothetical protein [Oligoflexia bacterium]
MEIVCYSCKKKFERDESRVVARTEECPHCGFHIRCCKMCDFYDPTTYNECRELMAERVVEKDKSNFCNCFRINPTKGSSHEQDKQVLASAADALFKKKD